MDSTSSASGSGGGGAQGSNTGAKRDGKPTDSLDLAVMTNDPQLAATVKKGRDSKGKRDKGTDK